MAARKTKTGGGGGDFRKSFSEAKKSGAKKFSYNGKSYTTQTAEEKAKKQSIRENLTAASKSSLEAGKRQYKSKSHNEIANSYGSAYSNQYNAMSLADRKKHDAGLTSKKNKGVPSKSAANNKKPLPKSNVYTPGKGIKTK